MPDDFAITGEQKQGEGRFLISCCAIGHAVIVIIPFIISWPHRRHGDRSIRNFVPRLMVDIWIGDGQHGIVVHLEIVDQLQVPIDYVQYEVVQVVDEGAPLEHPLDIQLVELLLARYD